MEKIVKLWTVLPRPIQDEDKVDSLDSGPNCRNLVERPIYTREQYIRLTLEQGMFMAHDYSSESTEENPRMIAFFDTLVQRETVLQGDSSSSDEDKVSTFSLSEFNHTV